MGTIYLIHFDQPYKHARHYLGYTDNLVQRLACHQAGNGSRLMEVVGLAGITWRLARTWEGDRALERKLHNFHGSIQLCPICKKESK